MLFLKRTLFAIEKKITADVFPSHWADKSKAKKTFKGCDIMVELVGVLFQNRKQAFTFVPPHTIKKKFVVDFEIDFDHTKHYFR